MMFGQPDEVLIANLEAIRQRLCCYYTPNPEDTCDCKFGGTGKGEQTGCPELRQAIAIISGQREQVMITKELFEVSAKNAMGRIRQVVDAYESTLSESNPEVAGAFIASDPPGPTA